MPRRRKTTSEFIEQAKQVHGDKCDYSLVEYVHSNSKVRIICPEHGEFKQTADNHLQGNGCKKCGFNQIASKNSFNTEQFIEKAKKVHGDRYDYSLVEYVDSKSKVKIICQEHGVFEQTSANHLTGYGCIKCSRKETKSTTSEFIEKSKKVHGDRYDYSLVDYVNNCTKVKIICPQHGEFEQRPNSHYRGNGCKQCGFNIRQRLATEQFIEKAKKIHGDKFDYSLVEYVHSNSKVKIICPEHGEFSQEPSGHLRGNEGCKKCVSHQSRIRKTYTTEQFIEKARKVHGDKYDYSMSEYVGGNNKVKIICPGHGVFEQKPRNHNEGQGCNKCHQRGWSFSDWYDIAKKSEHFDSFKIYFIKCYDEDEAFYKIGITYREISTRFYPSTLPYQYEVINTKEVKDINDKEGARFVYNMENRFKRFNKSHRYIPKKKFRGMTECFSSDGPLGWSRTVLKNNNKIYNTKSIYSEK